MIKAIVWDMGGVLVDDATPPSRQSWEASLGLGDGELTRMVFHHPVALELQLGKADYRELWNSLETELGLPEGRLEPLARDFWGQPRWNDALLSYIEELKRLRHALLSDAWPGTRELVEARISADSFDVIMFSYEEGTKKPLLEVYTRMSERLGLDPAEIVFIDDRLANVEGARRAGMDAIEFSSLGELRQELEQVRCIRL